MNSSWSRALALVAGICAAGTAAAQDKVIKIGTLFPLTGPVAVAGTRCKAAVEGWRYDPATAPDGRTVDTRIEVPFKFAPQG